MARSSTTFSATNRPKTTRGKSARTRMLEALAATTIKDENGKDIPFTENRFYQVLANNVLREPGLIMSVLQRLIPPDRPTLPPISFDFDQTDTPNQRLDKLLAAVAAGTVPPDVADVISKMLTDGAKMKEITEFEDRLRALEAKAAGVPDGD